MGSAAKNTKHKYIQVLIDHHTRYVWAFPSVRNTTQTIVNILTNIRNSGHNFRSLLSDNFKSFTNKTFRDYLSQNKIKQILGTPYHPQTQGSVERVNGTLIMKLRTALLDLPKRKWSTLLKDVVSHYNQTPHRITGFSPEYLLFGINKTPTFGSPPIPLEEARTLAIQRTTQAIAYRKRKHDEKHQHLELNLGQQVLKQIPYNAPSTKTDQRWKGPYFVINKITDVTYDISEHLSSGPLVRAHISQLKVFVPREQTQEAEESVV